MSEFNQKNAQIKKHLSNYDEEFEDEEFDPVMEAICPGWHDPQKYKEVLIRIIEDNTEHIKYLEKQYRKLTM